MLNSSEKINIPRNDRCSIPQHKVIIETLLKDNENLKLENTSLHLKIQDLEDKTSKNSSNSSKPPSSDGYEKPAPKSRRKKSGKKAGGQPGHEGSRLEPVDIPDHTIVYEVDVCSQCGRSLSDVAAKNHECRQEFDIPIVEPIVTEHRAEIKLCPDCKNLNTAQFPEHITQVTQYGSRVKATATYFNQAHFIPFKRVKEVFKDCYNLPASPGSFVNFNNNCAKQIEPSLTVIKKNIINSKVSGFDESGMRVNAKLHWLHVARNDKNTYYEIHEKRGQKAMEDIGILPKFKGTATHDHWKPYYTYTECTHGLCNAHHLRELEFAHNRYDQVWAKKMMFCLREINNTVKSYNEKGFDKLTPNLITKYNRKYSRILREGKEEILALPVPTPSKRGKPKQHKVKNLWDRLRDYKQDTLRFMNDFNVDFTNNGPEGDIRMCKVKSKVSGSFRSKGGANTFCKIRSYISTAKKNSINIMDALSNAFKGKPFIPPDSS